MSRVHFVKAAAKDYPKEGIKKGESYYWWQSYRGPRQLSKERPKQSQTASSEYARSVYNLVEQLEAWSGDFTEDDRDQLVSDIEGIRDEEQSKFDNLPEGFQQGDTGQQIEQRIADLDEWISELESIDFPEEGEEEKDSETPLEKALASAVQP